MSAPHDTSVDKGHGKSTDFEPSTEFPAPSSTELDKIHSKIIGTGTDALGGPSQMSVNFQQEGMHSAGDISDNIASAGDAGGFGDGDGENSLSTMLQSVNLNEVDNAGFMLGGGGDPGDDGGDDDDDSPDDGKDGGDGTGAGGRKKTKKAKGVATIASPTGSAPPDGVDSRSPTHADAAEGAP